MTRPLKIGFQGRLGAYSESACLHLYGDSIELFPYASFEQVFKALQKDEIDHAVLPFENSTTGSVHENYDLILKYRFPIQREIKLAIEHTLMARPGVSIAELTEVRSHWQALAQCSEFFEKHPHIQAVPDFDTAGSAEKIADMEGNLGAIASELAAHEYGLEILAKNLENRRDSNFTRFLALGKKEIPRCNTAEKTSLIYTPRENRSGVLFEALKIFAEAEIDLLKVESRPRQGSPWQYLFYLDLMGSPNEKSIQSALDQLSGIAENVHLLGHYPPGETKAIYKKRN